VRVLLLSHHYRGEWEYNADEMRAADEVAAALTVGARLAGDVPSSTDDESATSRQARLEFVAALEDDFDTPRAVQALERLAASATRTSDAGQAATLRELGGVLGLRLDASAAAETSSAQVTSAAN
jgi:cysteinyl-tRNA synthetase